VLAAGYSRAMRFPILMPLLLAGCGQSQSNTDRLTRAEARAGAEADASGRILCAHDGASDFTRACTLDRVTSPDGLVLTVGHPDGGFHRLLVTKDGRGVVAADGAEVAKVSIISPDEIEVALGDDRYRLPATVEDKAAKAGQ